MPDLQPTAQEKALIRFREKYSKALQRLNQRFAAERSAVEAAIQLPGACNHTDYDEGEWHHGYGKYLPKYTCNLCGAVNHWPGLHKKPSDWTSRARYLENLLNSKDDD